MVLCHLRRVRHKSNRSNWVRAAEENNSNQSKTLQKQKINQEERHKIWERMSDRSSFYKMNKNDRLFKEEGEADGPPPVQPSTHRGKSKGSKKKDKKDKKKKEENVEKDDVELEFEKNGVTRISEGTDEETLLIDLDSLQHRLKAFNGRSGMKFVDANANPVLNKGGRGGPEGGARRRGVATPHKASTNVQSTTKPVVTANAGSDAPSPSSPSSGAAPPATPCSQPPPKYTEAQLNDPLFRQRLQSLYRGFVPDPSEDYVDQQFRRAPMRNGIPWRGICLSLFLLCSGLALLGTLFTGLMGYIEDFNRKDRVVPLTILGLMTFIPGSYHSYIIFMAAMGARGYTWEDIPEFD